MPFQDPYLPEPDGNGYVSPLRPATPVQVFRVDPSSGTYALLPSIACIGIEEFEGAHPPVATFRYKFDGLNPASPQTPEQALSQSVTRAQFPDLVEINDELAVLVTAPDGTTEWIFHGRPLTFALKVDPRASSVIIGATSVVKDAWNTPVAGALVRNSNDIEKVNNDVPTDRVGQFNPKGKPNATPSTADSGQGDYQAPVFMDPTRSGTDGNGQPYPRMFDLPMACAYLLFQYVRGPRILVQKRSILNALLVARNAIGGVPFDPNDTSTFVTSPIQAADTPLRGRPAPALVYDFIKDSGFGMRWLLGSSQDSGLPLTLCGLYLKQAQDAKPLMLQPRGAQLDVTLTNLGAADLSRDLAGVVNRWVVRGSLIRKEVSLVLSQGFPSQASDSASTASQKLFDAEDPAFATSAQYNAYRFWIFDEDGTGHYDVASTTKRTTATTLDDIFPPLPPVGSTPALPQYVKTRRKPIGELFKLDPAGKPLLYRLHISTDYTGPSPGIWDGTGTWKHCQGGFRLLNDRIGIYISIKHPNEWNIGKGSAPFPSGIVPTVSCISNPDGVGVSPPKAPKFFLRLTCVIEGDQAVEGIAERADTSPITQVITREVDAADRIFLNVIAKHSEFNNTPDDVVVRDDTKLAVAEAEVSRRETESGLFEGSVMIPRFTTYYQIGDRISEIEGRDLGFRTDSGGDGFAPVYPSVVSRRWEFEGGQRTVLTLSDAGLDRRRYGRTFTPPNAPTRDQMRRRLNRLKAKADLGSDPDPTFIKI